ncbi:MAG: hypothetical protein AAFQ89_08715 [Cyanobacteria bacterium J06626_18]
MDRLLTKRLITSIAITVALLIAQQARSAISPTAESSPNPTQTVVEKVTRNSNSHRL